MNNLCKAIALEGAFRLWCGHTYPASTIRLMFWTAFGESFLADPMECLARALYEAGKSGP